MRTRYRHCIQGLETELKKQSSRVLYDYFTLHHTHTNVSSLCLHVYLSVPLSVSLSVSPPLAVERLNGDQVAIRR